jgi:hypothetical protein
MPDSIRQQIIEALDTQLKTILTTGGYTSNLGSKVFEYRSHPLEESDLPCLIYRDLADTIAQTFGEQEHRLTVSLDIIANTTAKVLRGMIADVHKCIGGNLTLGGLCMDILPVSDEAIEVQQDDRKFYGVSMKIVIQFVTANWNPYA